MKIVLWCLLLPVTVASLSSPVLAQYSRPNTYSRPSSMEGYNYVPSEIRAENREIHRRMDELVYEIQNIASEPPSDRTMRRIERRQFQLARLRQRDNQIHMMYGAFGRPGRPRY